MSGTREAHLVMSLIGLEMRRRRRTASDDLETSGDKGTRSPTSPQFSRSIIDGVRTGLSEKIESRLSGRRRGLRQDGFVLLNKIENVEVNSIVRK